MARRDPRNVTRYWWDRHLTGLSLLAADFTDHDYPPHSHEALVVAVTELGGALIKSRGQIEEADSARLFVFNPAEPHAGWMGWSRRWRYRSLYLTQAALDALAAQLGIARVPYFTRNRFDDADLIAGFLELHRVLEQGRDPFRERQCLAASFGRLFARHGSGGDRLAPAPTDRGRFRAATAVMRARLACDLRLEALAQEVGLTTFQLIGLFKRATGLTPHAYLTQLRLGAACRELRHGVPPAAAASAVGFYDQSALNKHFKRCYGITPLQFQKAAQF
jgi:AraC-like DNA-binding protein